jgi:hypothetical protein
VEKELITLLNNGSPKEIGKLVRVSVLGCVRLRINLMVFTPVISVARRRM